MTASQLIEEWRPIAGYEGVYEVSNLGRVQRMAFSNNPTPDGVLVARVDRRGLCRVTLSINNKPRVFLVRRLVAEAFHGPCPKGMYCRQLDSDPANCRADNLAWGTMNQCRRDQIRNGNIRRNVVSKGDGPIRLTPDAVREMRRLRFDEHFGCEAIAAKFGVRPETARRAITGKTWSHVR